MRKYYLFTVLACICLLQPAFAQESKVTSAWNYIQSKDYDKARDAANIAVANERTKTNPSAWLYRGQAYQGIYADAKLKTTEPNALKEAAASYRKAIELYKKENDKIEAKEGLTMVTLLLYNEGEGAFAVKNYALAQDRFDEFLISYDALGSAKKKVDDAFASTKPPTDIREVKLLLAGCAIQLKQEDKAKKLLEELAATKYPNTAVYVNLAKDYLDEKDTAKAYAILDKGIEALPDDLKGSVLIEKLKLLVNQGKNKEAIAVGEDALAHQPKNISLYKALGKMYSEQKNYEKAIEVLNKAAAISPNNFGITSRLGIIKFNKGVDKYNMYIDAKAQADQDKYLNEAKTIWKDAIKDLEGALTLPQDKNDRDDVKATYEALSQMYYQMEDPTNGKKYKELSKKQ
jgi:tetratricopeptide (TPR) repeat protein